MRPISAVSISAGQAPGRPPRTTRKRIQMRANALLAASPRRPRIPTAAPNIRTPDVRSNLLPGDAAAVGHGSSHEPALERHGRSNERRGGRRDDSISIYDGGGDGGVRELGYGCESRAQTGISIRVRADGSTSRDAHMWRAGAGAPLHASSLMPWKMATHRSRWAPSPRRGGAGLEEATIASSVANERMAQSGGLRSKTVARTFFDRPVQADEADAARCEHHEAMRNVRGAPRVIGRAHLSGLAL